MKKLFADNLKASFIFAVLAVVFTLFKILPLGVVFGIWGFVKSGKAIGEKRYWGILSLVLNLLPVLYLVLIVFILGYVFTQR